MDIWSPDRQDNCGKIPYLCIETHINNKYFMLIINRYFVSKISITFYIGRDYPSQHCKKVIIYGDITTAHNIRNRTFSSDRKKTTAAIKEGSINVTLRLVDFLGDLFRITLITYAVQSACPIAAWWIMVTVNLQVAIVSTRYKNAKQLRSIGAVCFDSNETPFVT